MLRPFLERSEDSQEILKRLLTLNRNRMLVFVAPADITLSDGAPRWVTSLAATRRGSRCACAAALASANERK